MIRSSEQDALKHIPDDAWSLYEVTDTYRRFFCKIDEHRTAFKTEYLGEDEIVRQNQEEFNDSHGKRFGDGRVVARIPLNVFYSPEHQIVQKMQEGDDEHMKWWLNSEAARPYRNFRGKV